MAGPTEDEIIQFGIAGVNGAMGAMGVPRQYDILFTNNGIAFAVVVSGLRMASVTAGGVGLGAIGGLAAGKGVDSSKVKMREQFNGLSVKEILKLNDKSFFVAYSDITQVTYKKGLTGIGKVDFFMPEGRFRCELAKAQIEPMNNAITNTLGAKFEQ